nr:NAD(P)-dependent oxidoreductase [Mycobacterium lepromatosis]
MIGNTYLGQLRLAGKRVVIGGGTIAQRRFPLITTNGADVHVVSRTAAASSRR